MAGEAYMDQDLMYGDMLKNLISPPDEEGQQAGTSVPQQVATPPANEPPNPVLKQRPAAPVQQPAAAAVPATVTPNGAEKGPQKSWADYVRAGLDRGIAASDASQKSLQSIQNQPTAEEQNAALIQKRAGIAQPLNPKDPEYKPGIGTRIVRGIDAFRRGGVLGVADPGDVGAKPYSAPNRQFDIDTARRQQQAQGIDTEISQNEAAQKADSERLGKLATDQRAQATTALDIGKTATAQQAAEDKSTYQGQIADLKQQLADQGGVPKTYEQAVIASKLEKDPAKAKALDAAAKQMATTELKKFTYAARAQGDPYDERRQALIDAATAEVQKMNDGYDYDADTNTFFDPNSPQKTFSPQEFTDMKNKIATKLDKDLTTKKLRPLGVRFNVKATTPSAQPATQPQAAPQAPSAGAKPVDNVQVGQTYKNHQYLGGDKNNPASWKWVGQGPDPYASKRQANGAKEAP